MYVQGVSTRKVAAITEQLCGTEISSAQVSRAAAALDAELKTWRDRPLGEMPYLILDARYEKVRHGGSVISCAVLVAIGIDAQGHRAILGTSVSLSEAEPHWRDFLAGLQARGLHGVRLVASDAHAGLKEALKARFSGVPWQRCQFHLAQNAMAYVPKVAMRKEVGASLRAVFDAPDRAEAERQLDLAVTKYRTTAPRLAAVAGGQRARGTDGLRAAVEPPEAAEDDEHAGADQPGDQAADEGGDPVPQRGLRPPPGQHRVDGDQRGVGDEPEVRDDGIGVTCRPPRRILQKRCCSIRPSRPNSESPRWAVL